MYRILRNNIWLIIKFEFVLGGIISIGILPLAKIMFSYTLKFTGLGYISQSNAITFIKNPVVLIEIILALYIISMVTIFEINALNIIYIKSSKNQTMTTMELIESTIVNSLHMFKSKNLLLFIYIVIFLPLAGVVYKNPLIEKLSIPSFILDSIYNSTKLTTILTIVYLFIFLMSLISIYIFIVMLVEKKNYYPALRRSIKLFNERKTKLVPKLLLKSSILAVILFVIYFIQSITLDIVMNINNDIYKVFAITMCLCFGLILGSIINAFIKVVMLYTVNELYFTDNPLPQIKEAKKRVIRVPKVIIGIVTVLIISFLGIVVCVLTYFIEPTDIAVMAHRGSSIVELENTKEAFIKAMEDDIKYIELDVVETKDKQVVIVHDLDLKRLANIDKKVSELNWNEIKDINIYSEDKSKYGHIMLLKELLQIVEKDVILNIELKPNDCNDEELALLVEDIIAYYPRHMICSFSRKSLNKIKDINPNRKTGLIMAIALGNYEDISFVDFYSIEQSFVTESSVAKIHENGKQVFAWTVNDTEYISDYLVNEVDGIITDYPNEMIKAVKEAKKDFTEYTLEKLFINKK